MWKEWVFPLPSVASLELCIDLPWFELWLVLVGEVVLCTETEELGDDIVGEGHTQSVVCTDIVVVYLTSVLD